MDNVNLLRNTLKPYLKWYGARLSFLALFLIALFRVKTVNLVDLSIGFKSKVKKKSNYKRLQRFLRDFDYEEYLKRLEKKTWQESEDFRSLFSPLMQQECSFIRQVTQLNTGRKTAGIDGKKSLTFEERFQLEEFLRDNTKTWKHQGLREIPIPKKDGSKRILKVPTIADRAWQCLVKYAHFTSTRSNISCQKLRFQTRKKHT